MIAQRSGKKLSVLFIWEPLWIIYLLMLNKIGEYNRNNDNLSYLGSAGGDKASVCVQGINGWPRRYGIRLTFSPGCATSTYDMDSLHQDLFGMSPIDDSTFETQNTPSTWVDSLGSPCVHCLELGRRCPRCRLSSSHMATRKSQTIPN